MALYSSTADFNLEFKLVIRETFYKGKPRYQYLWYPRKMKTIPFISVSLPRDQPYRSAYFDNAFDCICEAFERAAPWYDPARTLVNSYPRNKFKKNEIDQEFDTSG